MQTNVIVSKIKVIIGLGNPGKKFEFNRHNIGFLVLDALADKYHASWRDKESMSIAQAVINDRTVLFIKPQTFMNSSGNVIPFLTKQGVRPEEILVVHDELELPFGQLKLKTGGSHKGHNGLRSIIGVCGDQFIRLRFGIGRPEKKEDVPDYVLANFTEPQQTIHTLIGQAISMIEGII